VTSPGVDDFRRKPASGRQLAIAGGGTSAVVTEVGGGLRALSFGDVRVIDGYAEEEMCTGGRGQVLFPWPNRLEDGCYEFEGLEATAALDEPEAHNAIHGLVRWLRWSLEAEAPDVAVARCRLAPQPGYPWGLAVSLTYRVGASSLSVDVSVASTGEAPVPAPFGIGFHPYLDAGEGGVDGVVLRLPAATRLLTDDRGLPRAAAPTAGTEYDFREGRPIGALRLDDCFTDLPPSWSVGLERSDGMSLELFAEEGFDYVMCYSGDTLPPPERRRALAVEPMTCPPNALRSGESLVVLSPGETWEGRWGIRES
jgi:aldose 1-epimerase